MFAFPRCRPPWSPSELLPSFACGGRCPKDGWGHARHCGLKTAALPAAEAPREIETFTEPARQLRKHPLTPTPLPQSGEGLKRDVQCSPSLRCFLPSLAGEGARRADGGTLAAASSRQQFLRRQKRQDSRLPPAEKGDAPVTGNARNPHRQPLGIVHRRIPTLHSRLPSLQGFLAAAGSLTIFSRSFCRSANSGSIFCWMAPIRFWVSAGVLSSRLWPAELS